MLQNYPITNASFHYKFPPFLNKFAKPVENYLTENRYDDRYDGICTGAFTLDNMGKMLIVQRADTDSWPGRWEIPGGACEATDKTILDGMVREMWEESGLIVTNIVGVLNNEGKSFTSRRRKRYLKFEFEVEIEPSNEIRLNPAEHKAFMWITEEEFHARKKDDSDITFQFTTELQADSVREVFQLWKKRTAN
ncbi:putative nudix domain protein [Erysiphe neolycopersici]|uniref:Putative nudix domain protein n=1 Tax=Erysiphe neolycopersici TaxID=212602 RepID=A0A420HPK6_9PEZI|nr:putative nudix domain protein [Erysiphe neolycopersici]